MYIFDQGAACNGQLFVCVLYQEPACLISEDSSKWPCARIITVNNEEDGYDESQKIQERGKMLKGNDGSIVVPA